jgi:hypothetical protein
MPGIRRLTVRVFSCIIQDRKPGVPRRFPVFMKVFIKNEGILLRDSAIIEEDCLC